MSEGRLQRPCAVPRCFAPKLEGSVQLCPTWEPTAPPWEGGWKGWSLQELMDTAELPTAPALAVVAEVLWGSTQRERELKSPQPHDREIIGFAALNNLQYAIYELRKGSRKAVQAGHCCCLCPAAPERQLDPLPLPLLCCQRSPSVLLSLGD